MKESDLLERYALALQLVPDPDVAGDLFMQTRSEAALRARANRWREQQGLEPVTLPLPRRPLTAEEAEHALHLARRGIRRRRLFTGGAVAALLALVVGGLSLVPVVVERPAQGLAADPVYATPPLQQVQHPEGYRVSIHKVEADPGSVTIWWSATGAGAVDAADTLKPFLMLDSGGSAWLSPNESQFAAPRRNRMIGLSTFHTFVTVEHQALLSFGEPAPDWPSVLLRLPLDRKIDEGARTIELSQGPVDYGPAMITLHSVVLGRNYTLVRYTTTVPRTTAPSLYSLRVGTTDLTRKGPVTTTPDGLQEVLFEALPQKVDRIYLGFTPISVSLPPRTYEVDQAEVFTRSGQTATAVNTLEDFAWGATAQGFFTGAGGERYPAELSFQVEGQPVKHRIMLRSESVSEEATIRSFTLTGLRYVFSAPVPVELPQ